MTLWYPVITCSMSLFNNSLLLLRELGQQPCPFQQTKGPIPEHSKSDLPSPDSGHENNIPSPFKGGGTDDLAEPSSYPVSDDCVAHPAANGDAVAPAFPSVSQDFQQQHLTVETLALAKDSAEVLLRFKSRGNAHLPQASPGLRFSRRPVY